MEIIIHVLREDWADPAIALPDYATAGAAGADLRANLPVDHRQCGITLAPMARAVIPTGLRVAIPHGHEMQIRPRSGLALKYGLSIPNAPGTIDSDYRGPVGILMINLGADPVTLAHGERVAQAVIAPVMQARYQLADTLPGTARGAAGVGSTGVA